MKSSELQLEFGKTVLMITHESKITLLWPMMSSSFRLSDEVLEPSTSPREAAQTSVRR
jgi:hypothetical protein